MSDQSAASTDARPNLATDVQAQKTFFVRIAGALLLILLLGFGPTLYLRAYFDVPEVPAYLLVHHVLRDIRTSMSKTPLYDCYHISRRRLATSSRLFVLGPRRLLFASSRPWNCGSSVFSKLSDMNLLRAP